MTFYMLGCKDRKRQTNRYAEKTIFYANNNKPRKQYFRGPLKYPHSQVGQFIISLSLC